MVGRSALRGSDKHSNIDSMAGAEFVRRGDSMAGAEEADSISGGGRLRGSARHIDANSIAGRSCMAEELGPERGPEELGPELGIPRLRSRREVQNRREVPPWRERQEPEEEEDVPDWHWSRYPRLFPDLPDSSAAPPPHGSRSRSDMDSSVACGAPRRGVGGHIKADLLESTDDSDSGWLGKDPAAGLRKDASLSLDRQKDRYLIILQNNVVPFVGGAMNLDVDWLKPDMDKYTIVGESRHTASA